VFVARNPEVPAVFSREKGKALRRAVEVFDPTHVILDDAFQSWGIARDIDIVLLDARAPFGNGRILPAGRLREEPSAIARATHVGFNGVDSREELVRAASQLRDRRLQAQFFGLRRRLQLGAGATDEPALVVSSIARPEGLERMLLERDVDLRGALRYPDHHAYTVADVGRIDNEAAARGAGCIITTEKDWVKLRRLVHDPERYVVATLELEVVGCDIAELTNEPRDRSPAA